MNDAMSGSKNIDWARYFELVNLRDTGQVEEAILELTKLGEKTQDRAGRALAFLEVANGLRTLRRVSEARQKVQQACELLGAQHELYPRAALQAAVLDLDESNAKGALRKLDAILKNHMPVLQMEQHKDLLEEVQRNRGIALAELRRFHEARTILEPFRSEPYERERNIYYLAACAYELGDLSAARRDFEEMLSLEAPPAFRAYAHEYLGRIFYDGGQIARAKIVFEKCLAFSDRDRNRDEILLKWLITLSKELNQTEDIARYSEMLRRLPLT